MDVSASAVLKIVTSVFRDLLGLPVHQAATETAPPINGRRLVATVFITGDSENQVAIEAPKETAEMIGEVMFEASPGSLDTADVSDAVGEVVNIIAGSVKDTCPADLRLSVPEVTCGADDSADSEHDKSIVLDVAGKRALIRWRDATPAAV